MTIQMILAASCILSQKNVRRTAGAEGSLDTLKADIAARGVLQNLIGFAIPKKRGKFEITAGGRRLAAVHALIAEGTLPGDHQIPVFVMNDTAAASETSLAENFQRLAMNPADECTAFRHFIDVDKASIDDIARRFGLTSRFVEGRIRLASLADEVFEALRADEITLEVAQAFGTTSDTARQAAVYAQLKTAYYGIEARTVRRMMMDETIKGTHAWAKLVGRDAYITAGGRIESDLFAEAADEMWLDSALLRTLAEAKMAEAATSLTGYGNVVPVLDHRPDWQATQTLRPVQGTPIEPTEAERQRLTEIATELEAIEDNAEDPEGIECTDEENARFEALQAETEAIENRIAPVDDATKAAATVFVVIGPDGAPKLHETIYIDPRANNDGAGTIVESAGTGIEVGPAGLGKPLRDELAVQRTQLLALHVANDAGMAIDLAVFLLADAQVSLGRCYDRASSLRGEKPTRAPFGYIATGAAADQLQAFSDALDYSWAEHRETGARFDAFRALDDDKRGAWAGWTVARTLEPKIADDTESAFANHLGRSLGIDVAAWWRPTAANFFKRVRKGVILDALTAIGGSDLKSRYANAKKGDLAEAAEKLCAGTSIVEAEVRAKALAWVPDVMTFGNAADPTPATAAGPDDETETDGDDEEPIDDEPGSADNIDTTSEMEARKAA